MRLLRLSLFSLCLMLSARLTAEESDLSLMLTQGYEAYLRGEQAGTREERSEAFNQAIRAYHSVAQNYENAQLYYNLGNCYFQVGELPWSLLYYYKAERLRPRDERISENLALAEKRLGLNNTDSLPALENLFFFHYYLSEQERHIWASLATLMAAISWSMYLWHPGSLWLSLRRWGGVLAVVLGISLFYSAYLEPIEALLMRSETLRRDAGHHYATVESESILSGSKVEVLDVVKEGYWIKVKTPNGVVGFVPHESIEMI